MSRRGEVERNKDTAMLTKVETGIYEGTGVEEDGTSQKISVNLSCRPTDQA